MVIQRQLSYSQLQDPQVLAIMPDDLNATPRTYMVEGEK